MYAWQFDDVYAWEIRSDLSHRTWWQHVPAELRARIRFFNVPVDAEEGAEHPSSFLTLLRATARTSDLVIVKVDIDSPPELEIVKRIAHDAQLASLVDEIYFECHYAYGQNLQFGWGSIPRERADTDSALLLFRTLRERGVRAHFWI